MEKAVKLILRGRSGVSFAPSQSPRRRAASGAGRRLPREILSANSHQKA